jgi:hypothetical protein
MEYFDTRTRRGALLRAARSIMVFAMSTHAATPAGADLIPSLVAGVASPRASVRFRSSKALALLAEESPELLYPRFDFFLKQLDSPNSILRWNATRALASLASADRGNKLEAALDKYLSPIPGPQMIGAAAAIRGAATIALAKPHLAERLARAILGVRRAVYEREECHNVAIGHTIESLERFFEGIADKKAVVESRPVVEGKVSVDARRCVLPDGRNTFLQCVAPL